MPPKGKKPSSADKSRDVQETEDHLQAVVLADSFETRFRPFTLKMPRCLLPLANTPLIEYTLEFLANSGVEEVYVYCGAHTEIVEEYLLKSRWLKSSSPFSLEIIKSTSRSIGDAMRDLDKRSIMSKDFLVVYGDIVSNVPLGPALAEHKTRRLQDKNAIMTMVLREAGVSHRTKAQGTSPVFVVEPTKKRCLHYEQMSRTQPSHRVEIDPEILLSHDEVDVRHDLIDGGIDICTPDVLALWSDNFDYEAPRKGFLHSVLKDYELNGKTIHTYITKNNYSARVRDLRTYSSISKDIVSRWAYPMCPDTNISGDQSYRLQKGNVYLEETVKLSRSCTIGRNTVIGRGTSVAGESIISNSTIGRNCVIGENCTIDQSYLWDGVTLKDGTNVQGAVIAGDCIIGKNCNLKDGTLISYGVELDDGTVTGKRQRLAKLGDAYTKSGPRAFGSGNASEYEPSDSEDEDTKAGLYGSVHNLDGGSLSDESISTVDSEFSEEEVPIDREHTKTSSFASVASDDSHQGHQGQQAVRDFHADATASIVDSLQKGHEASTIQLELQAQRMAANASEHQVRHAVVSGLVDYIMQVRKTGKTTIKQVLVNNFTLIKRVLFDENEAIKKDQVDFLLLAQAELAKKQDGPTVMVSLCNGLLGSDLIETEGLEQWWKDAKSTASEKMKAVRSHSKMAELMELIEQSSEEEESEDEDEEDD